jgi:hypothetical protein
MSLISGEDIRETFYNLMLDVALDHNMKHQFADRMLVPSAIKNLVTEAIRLICRMATSEGFPTLRGGVVNSRNVPPEYAELFAGLERLRLIRDQVHSQMVLDKIISEVEKKGTFRDIIGRLISFYTESQREAKTQIDDNSIRETFYNIMVEELLINHSIDENDLDDRDAYIYIAMSSQTILASALHSKNLGGIMLYNGSIVTEANCPEKYKVLFKQLIMIKDKLKLLNLNPDQLQLVKLYSMSNPRIIIPQQLEALKTPQLMSIVSIITNIAIEISKIRHFKEIIDDVVKFCLGALKQN